LIDPPPIQWSIFTIDPDPAPDARTGRPYPALVVSRESANVALPVVTVVPLTRKAKHRRVYPNEVLLRSGTAGLEGDAIAMAHLTRAVAKSRLTAPLGTIEDDDLKAAVRRAMRVQLGLEPG
jgi:mRNA-degrading endonuclease toxin of MazEF toxin-antitoxin module